MKAQFCVCVCVFITPLPVGVESLSYLIVRFFHQHLVSNSMKYDPSKKISSGVQNSNLPVRKALRILVVFRCFCFQHTFTCC